MIDNQKYPDKNLDNMEKNLELSEELKKEEFVIQDDNVILETDKESIAPEKAPENPVNEQINPSNSPETNPETTQPDAKADDPTEAQQVVKTMQQENASLKQQLTEQIEKTESFKTQYLRIAADFDNFRKRTQKEQENLEKQAKRTTINELLSVVDNFERARTQLKPANDGEMAIHKSYQGVYKNLVDSLKRIGVSAMRPEGQPFDPNDHEAMLREATDEYPDGTVIEQLVRGYLLGDQVLRHAMVKVAAPKEDETDEELTTQEKDDSSGYSSGEEGAN